MCPTLNNDPSITPDVLRGLWVPLITPFQPDGSIDHPALRALVRRCVDQGVDGFVACGSTGEAAALSSTEQLEILESVLQASGNCPVIMGLSGYHLADTVAWVKTLSKFPIAGLLIPAPHYIRPSQAGLQGWFEALADASSVPVVIYDIPYRTGVTLTCETLLKLAMHPRIQAIKDCAGDLVKTLTLIADGRLNVLVGDDIQMFSTLAQGGHGAIAASAHVHTDKFVSLLRQIGNAEWKAAQAQWIELFPLIHNLFAEPNPAPVKALLADCGEIEGGLRAPMQPVSPALADTLKRLASQ